jgi:hypothetical protein
MVDRADDDIAAGREDGGDDDDEEGAVSHPATIAARIRRRTTQGRDGPPRRKENVDDWAIDCIMDSSCLHAAPTLVQGLSPGFGLSIRETLLQRLYGYWLDCKGDRRMPARRDIDPLDFPYLLGSIMLVDVVRDPLRFRVRLHGTNLVKLTTHDLTGKLLDEIPSTAYRDYVLERCRGLVASGEPAVVHHGYELDGRLRNYEALWLPLADDETAVTMLLCAVICENRREHPRSTPIA